MFGLGIWLINSAVKNRAPIQVLKDIITGTPVPQAMAEKYANADSWQREIDRQTVSRGQDSWDRTGNVDSWVSQAMAVMQQSGMDMSKVSASDIKTIIHYESGGNPAAINLWDSNAKAGHPSQGLMQTIPSTFRAHMLPGHGDILNPVDNIIAGVRYAVGRYGSTSNLPGMISLRNGGKWKGY